MVKNKYAVVILAAGESSRLGHPKQLVKWKETTLLNHIIGEASKVSHSDVYVILGGNYTEIKKSILQETTILFNPDWKDGMGSTISFSVKKIFDAEYDAIILSVCDQPYLTHQNLDDLIETFEFGKDSIVVSKYNEKTGPPTLFSKVHFRALSKLKGDIGAKKVVKDNITHVGYVDFIQGYFDIDTENDLNQINKN